MFEPTPFPDTLPLGLWRLRGNFKDVPVKDPEHYSKQVYNYHSYCCNTSPLMCASGEPPLAQAEYCRKYHFETVNLAEEYSKKFNIPTIISEFGACFDSESCFHEISSLADAADEKLTSWAYWMYKPFGDFTTSCPDDKEGIFNQDGSEQVWKIKALTRSYVQAFQGRGISMKFDKENKSLKVELEADLSITQPTLVYYNKELNYKEGLRVFFDQKTYNSIDAKEVKVNFDDSEENILKITMDNMNGKSVTKKNVKFLLVGKDSNLNVDLKKYRLVYDNQIR